MPSGNYASFLKYLKIVRLVNHYMSQVKSSVVLLGHTFIQSGGGYKHTIKQTCQIIFKLSIPYRYIMHQ